MFTGDRIVIDHQYAQFMGMQNIFRFPVVLVVAVGQRNRDSKRRSFILFALYGNRSVHQLNNILGYGHT